MNNFIKKIVVVLLMVLLGLIFFKSLPHSPRYLDQSVFSASYSDIQRHPAFHQIQAINARNARLTTFSCKIQMQLRRNFFKTDLDAVLYHEKEKKFRMISWSRFRKEVDIGSNNMLFWFWSGRMKPPTLYYASHDSTLRTKLRTPFNPLWIMESLSIGQIGTKNARIADQEKYWVIIQNRFNFSGDRVIKITLIDKSRQAIAGHYLFNSKGVLIVSMETSEFQTINGHILPKMMHTIWYEENISINWNVISASANQSIGPEIWMMPSYAHSENL